MLQPVFNQCVQIVAWFDLKLMKHLRVFIKIYIVHKKKS